MEGEGEESRGRARSGPRALSPASPSAAPRHRAVLKFGLSGTNLHSPGDEYPPHIEHSSHALPAVILRS